MDCAVASGTENIRKLLELIRVFLLPLIPVSILYHSVYFFNSYLCDLEVHVNKSFKSKFRIEIQQGSTKLVVNLKIVINKVR